MKAYLSIDQLSCGYNRGFFMRGITFEVQQGQIAGIIGPNGSGKSTLFRGIAGDIPLSSGTVSVNGQDMHRLSLRERAKLMAVVTQFVDNSNLSVQEFVLLGRMPYRQPFQFFESREDIDIANHFMQLTDVYRLRDKQLNLLSGGEMQLACIARALTQQPRLLLLDEPTSHLDIMHQVQILNLIQQRAASEKITVLLIIHDLNLASEYCDSLVLLNNGQVHAKGEPGEILTYQHIEEVYKTVVITLTNPLSKRPAIFLISDKILKSET